MTSIRRHLTLRLGIVTLLIAIGGVAVMYGYLNHELREQFDNALVSRARTLASLVRVPEDEPTGTLEFESTKRSGAEYRPGKHPDYFEVWDGNGAVLARSDSLKGRDLPRIGSSGAANVGSLRAVAGRSRFFDLKLPDGRPGRAVEYYLEPGFEDEHHGEKPSAGAAPSAAPKTTGANLPRTKPVPLVLATNTVELRQSLGQIFAVLLIVSGAVSIGLSFAVVSTIRRGLPPLREIGDEVARIDPATLASRFDPRPLPEELRPIAEKLNELLARLDAAFRRERRFTSNVAHELRTPIAELRSLAEVAINWPGDQESAARNFQDSLGIARQMESVVTSLLAIARCQAGQQPLSIGAVALADVFAAAWRPHAATAGLRGLETKFDVDSAVVDTDRTVLTVVITNLLANAVTYTPVGGGVQCKGQSAGGKYVLDIVNDNDSLTQNDLRLLFEPFWRKDAARSDSSNSGLGLAMVATYSDLLGVKISASLPSEGTFAVRLEIPLSNETMPLLQEHDSPEREPAETATR